MLPKSPAFKCVLPHCSVGHHSLSLPSAAFLPYCNFCLSTFCLQRPYVIFLMYFSVSSLKYKLHTEIFICFGTAQVPRPVPDSQVGSEQWLDDSLVIWSMHMLVHVCVFSPQCVQQGESFQVKDACFLYIMVFKKFFCTWYIQFS